MAICWSSRQVLFPLQIFYKLSTLPAIGDCRNPVPWRNLTISALHAISLRILILEADCKIGAYGKQTLPAATRRTIFRFPDTGDLIRQVVKHGMHLLDHAVLDLEKLADESVIGGDRVLGLHTVL